MDNRIKWDRIDIRMNREDGFLMFSADMYKKGKDITEDISKGLAFRVVEVDEDIAFREMLKQIKKTSI